MHRTVIDGHISGKLRMRRINSSGLLPMQVHREVVYYAQVIFKEGWTAFPQL
jgi:hypothetical protein